MTKLKDRRTCAARTLLIICIHLNRPHPPAPLPSPAIMAGSITLRNLTPRPLELVDVERFDAQPAAIIRSSGILNNVTTVVSGFLNSTETSAPRPLVTQGSPRERHQMSVFVEPFQTRQTDIRAASRDRELLRLVFRSDNHNYRTDVPSPSGRAAVMEKLEGAPDDLTAVYLPDAAILAVFSSPRLDGWMRELDGGWPLTLLSIPGTHNSPACHKALPSVRCQAVGVAAQLRNGVRFLDIRVSANLDDDALSLVHGAFPVSLTGGKYVAGLLEDIYRFLDENPSETVLVSIKREGNGKASDGQLAKTLKNSYVDRRADRWWTEPRIPSLGEARGRIVLIRRFSIDDDMRAACWEGRGWGIDAKQWPDNCEDGTGGGGNFRIQDFYEVSESQNIEKKIALSRSQLERAAERAFALAGMPGHQPDAPTPPFFVNFLSASSFFNASCWPEKIAAKVNPAIVDYLCTCHGEDGRGPQRLKVGSAGTGIVVSDWVGANDDWDLVRCIVGMNARLQLQRP